MSAPDVIAALEAKRADVERLIDSYDYKIASLERDLSSMRAVLAHQAQDVPTSEFMPHMSVRRFFKRGEIFAYCREAMAASEVSLSTRELTRIVTARKGLDPEDGVIRKKIVFSVMQTMKTAQRKRLVKDDGKRLGVRLWRLTDRF